MEEDLLRAAIFDLLHQQEAMVQVYLQNYALRYLNKAMVHNVFSKQCIAAFVRSNGTSVFAKHFLAVFYETAAQIYF